MRLTKTKIILFLVVLLIGMLCFMPKTYATTYVSGDFKYEVSNNKAKITGYEGSNYTVSIPNKIGNYVVTEIGYNAFRNCSEIETLNIPSSIENIDEYAFSGCNFTTVKFASDCKIAIINGFKDMNNLTTINIPNNVKTIGSNAFASDTNLKSITIPNSVEKIDYCAFYKCTGITTFNIPTNVSNIDEYAFSECNFTTVKFADDCKITTIDGFNNMSKLTSINIPSKVKTIGSNAFANDTNLKSITIPNNVEKIDYCAVYKCIGLTTISIPTNVSSIDEYAFSDCNFTTVKFANDCKITEFAGFKNMSNLTSINIPNRVRKICSSAFSNDNKLTTITIPDSVREIEYSAFYKCTGLKTIKIPRRVEKIDEYAFSDCDFNTIVFDNDCMITEMPDFRGMKNLTSINIPRSVKNLGSSIFSNVTALRNLTIPSSVTSIGYSTFYGCKNLTIQIPKSVTSIDNDAFYNASGITVKCESGSTAQTFCKNKGISYQIVTIPATKTPIEISKTSITGYYAKAYTGKEITANLVVKYNGNTLNNGTDYVVEYDNNINIGNATITVIGFGDYIGKVQKNFKIVPATVTGVTSTVNTTSEVTLKWNKNNGNVSGYKVYTYDASSKLYNQIAVTSNISYKISGLKAGTTYRFAIKAYYTNSGTTYTSNDYSSVFVTTTTPVKTTFSKFSSGTDNVTVEWKKVSGATGYEVYMSTNSNGNYSKIITISNNNTFKYKKTKLSIAKNYYFKIRAYRVVGNKTYFGPFSNALTTTTKTKAPTISKLTSGKKKLTVKLKKVSGAKGYQIQYSTNKKFKKNNKSTNISKNTTKKTISKLSAKKKYYVRIRAYRNVNGKKIYSSWSKVKNVTTKK